MNVVDYHTTTSIPSPATWKADYLKNDFQTAIRRNLNSWVKWRTALNGNLVDAVMTGGQLTSVEPFQQYLNHDSPDPHHPTTNPKTLMTFSAGPNSSTNLESKDFYKYGIPRAKLDPRQQVSRVRLASDLEKSSSLPHFENDTNFLNTKVDQEDDELVLDYFNYQVTPPDRRRFHRSAATLPTVPPTSDSEGGSESEIARKRTTMKTKKSEERRLPPSYVEPFIRPRMITARRDNNDLYTRSAWHLDEL